MNFEVLAIGSNCPTLNQLSQPEGAFSTVLDHVIVPNESHLRRLLRDYLEYYHDDRIHDALKKDFVAIPVRTLGVGF